MADKASYGQSEIMTKQTTAALRLFDHAYFSLHPTLLPSLHSPEALMVLLLLGPPGCPALHLKSRRRLPRPHGSGILHLCGINTTWMLPEVMARTFPHGRLSSARTCMSHRWGSRGGCRTGSQEQSLKVAPSDKC